MVDEPVTVVVSLKGWVRALKGHEVDVPARCSSRPGDALYGVFPCRSVDTLAGLRQQRRASTAWPRRRCPAGAATARRSRR